ncbi:MAG: twin-arginine translocation signal domain-containing protein, partial [Candidatus Omnitrophica bacterium]|nr:twin-arginine translocation signal domain-containing protein [Candidatus Omnitrophota bacterium]
MGKSPIESSRGSRSRMPKETRRKFIRDAGLSAGALALGPLFRANRASANGWMGKVFQVDETRGVLSDG